MRKISVLAALLLITTLGSCQLIGDIFKAGVWTGILLVVVVVGLIIFLISRMFGGGK